jgi:hypothetical protein
MSGNGRTPAGWAYAVEGKPTTMLQIALHAQHRQGAEPRSLPGCNGEPCVWVRDVAACLASGECRVVILFCTDPGLACCIANKVPGVRAAAVTSVSEAMRALRSLGANLLVVEMAGRTYFECRELLRMCQQPSACPPGLACVLQELDGHAHR